MKKLLIFVVVSLLLSVVGVTFYNPQPANALGVTCTWSTTPVDTSFINTANWSSCATGSGIPESGDELVFPAHAGNALEVDYDGITTTPYASLTINGDYEFLGNSLRLSSNLTTASGISAILGNQIDFTSGSNVTVSMGGDFGTINFNGGINIALAGSDISFSSPDNSAQTISIGGDIVGTVNSLTFNNATTLLYGTNTFTTQALSGGIIVDKSSLYCEIAECMGNTSNKIKITNAGQIDYDIAGAYSNDLILDQGTIAPRVVGVIYTGDISVTTDSNIFTISGANIDVQGNVDLNNAIIDLSSADSTTEYITISGNITGTGDVNTATRLTSSGTNSFTGTFSVLEGGSADLTTGNAFGSNISFVVEDGGSLRTDATGTISNDFQLAGIGIGETDYIGAFDFATNNGDLTLTGNIVLTADARIAATALNAPHELHLNGVISGAFDLELNMPSPSSDSIHIGGTDPNTYNNLHVTGGVVVLVKAGAVPGNVTQDTTAGNTDSATIIVNAPGNAIGGSFDIIGSPFENGGSSNVIFESDQEITALTGTGIVAIAADSTLTINNALSNTFDGIFLDDSGVAGDRRIVKKGAGKFISTTAIPTNFFLTYPVIFEASEGITSFTNTDDNQMNVFVEGGTVSGSGILGSLTQDAGRVAPGNSPGCLTSAGDVDFGALDSSLDIELGGTKVCTAYDQVVSATDIDLNGTTLNLSLVNGFVPSVGDVFTIVRAPVVHGAFKSMVDGDTFKNGKVTYRLNYNFGLAGEDSVTLSVVAVDVDATNASASVGALPSTGSNVGFGIGVGFVLVILGCSIAIFIRKRRKSFFVAS